MAAVVLLSAMSAARAAAAEGSHRYVLIIANNRSLDPGVSPLRYADDDGARYFELFRLTSDRVALFSVFDDETARLFPAAAQAARAPEAGAIFDTLDRWNREMAAESRAGRETELVFIYAGHGEVDATGEGYVSLLSSKLRRSDLYQKILAPSKASFVHLIIDACKSYFLVNRRGGAWKDDSAAESHDGEIRAFLNREDLSAYPRAGVILATSGDQSTHEWTRFQGGILSHELRSALTGSADINGDGRVEYSEMHAFIAAANARLQHPEARLNVFVQPPQANRHQPLMDLRQANRGRLLRFDAELTGRFYLEDDRGVRYADLNKAAGIRFDMAVDRDRAYFVHRDEQEAHVSPGTARLAVARLSFRPSSMAARGSLDQTFRRDLYRVAYSRGFYEGFCTRTGLPPVEGGAEEFVIVPVENAPPAPVHSLAVGYLASTAPLDLEGLNHGVELRYDFAVHRNVTVGAVLEYARSTHSSGEGAFTLDRVAALGGVTGRIAPLRWLSLRAELALGYQGYWGKGPVRLLGREIDGESSDPLGFRLEAGLGAQVDLTRVLFADLRGGVAVELITVEPEEYAHAGLYVAGALGVRF